MSVTNIRVRTTSASAKPASASAALDDPEDRPRLGRRGRPDGGTAVRAGVGRAGDPAASRRRRSPGCSRRRPPTARPTRSAAARVTSGVTGSATPGRATTGSRAIASSSAASSVVRGTIESTSRYSVGRVVVAADRPEAVERRHAHARGRVRIRRAAGGRVADLEAEPPRERLRVLDEPPATARASPSATSGPSPRRSTVVSGTSVVGGDARGSPPRPPRGRSRVDGPHVDLERSSARRRRWAACPPSMTPDVDRHARPAAVERVERARRGRAAARIALRPFSGSTPAWAARPWTTSRRSRMPLRDETMSPLARAHSRTRHGVGVGGELADVRRGASASRSPRRGWRRTTSRSNGRPPAASRERRALERVEAGEQAGLHVGDARARRRCRPRSGTVARRRSPGRRRCPCGR